MWTLAAILSLALDSSAIAEYEYHQEAPEVLVRVPLPCPEGLEDNDRGHLLILVGETGFVEKTRFREATPVNAADLEAAVRRWMLKPLRDGNGKTIAVWTPLPTRSICVKADSGGVVQRWVPRPDSTLAARLTAVDSIVLDTAGTLRPAAGFGRDLLAILQDPKVMAADLRSLPCIPESFERIHLRGGRTTGATTIGISYVCEFMQIESPEAVLQVPYGAVKDRVRALLAKYFPERRSGTR
jgi:hypothetical protein